MIIFYLQEGSKRSVQWFSPRSIPRAELFDFCNSVAQKKERTEWQNKKNAVNGSRWKRKNLFDGVSTGAPFKRPLLGKCTCIFYELEKFRYCRRLFSDKLEIRVLNFRTFENKFFHRMILWKYVFLNIWRFYLDPVLYKKDTIFNFFIT